MYFIGLHNSSSVAYSVHNIGKIFTDIMLHFLRKICSVEHYINDSKYYMYTFLLKNNIEIKVLYIKGDINSTGLNIYNLHIYQHIIQNNVVIIYDDITLNVSQVKFNSKTKTNHNGSKSVYTYIEKYWDIRIGYKKAKHINTNIFVLSHIDLNIISHINALAYKTVNILNTQINEEKIIKALYNTLNKKLSL